MKKSIFTFFIILFSLSCGSGLFANEEDDIDYSMFTINTNDVHYNTKAKISIFRPCFVEKDDIYVEKKRDGFESEMTKIDDLLSDVTSDGSSGGESEKIKVETKLYERIYDKHHQVILDDMYKKIIKNLAIVNLYDITYESESCEKISDFFSINNTNYITDYIFSENFFEYDFVVTTELEVISENELKIEVFVWDIMDERFLSGKYFILKTNRQNDNSYRISNIISDLIFQLTTGESGGLFDSKIMYIAETGSATDREKQVVMMNFDGNKSVKITKGKNLKLTPIFSKYNVNEIFYMEYINDGAFIVKHDLKDNKMTKMTTKGQKMTSAPAFSPNGENKLIVSGTEFQRTNLFLFDLNKKISRQLTKDVNTISTSASFSPDGKKIVYVSDRSGSRRLYIQNLEDSSVADIPISSPNEVCDKPAWSPDGRLIAFVKISKGKFHLSIMTPDGGGVRSLISDYLIEGIRWSPNSRYLVYTKQSGAFGKASIPKLYVMDIMTKNEFQLKTPDNEGASDPDWAMNF
ncbi:MAG: hypothetical protein LBS34_02140 [Rickettsiales bacterium]|nr:hypothetical protein [Rickettsiales bacterium]